MVSPSICGGFLTDKRSMVAFTWTIATVLTIFAFVTSMVLVAEISNHYRRMERYYETDDFVNNYMYYYNQEGGEGGEEGGEQHHSGDMEKIQESYLMLSTTKARSITFASVYTMLLATGLSLYGTTAIVGFTSLRGVYIAPCFSSDSNMMKVGIFGGAIVLFANLLLVCAVILGEVRVEDFHDRDDRDRDEMEPYQVERIATVLAVTCMFLSALYTIFAILLFLCYAGDETSSHGHLNSHPNTTTNLYNPNAHMNHMGGPVSGPGGVGVGDPIHHHHERSPSHPKPLVTVTTTADMNNQRHIDMDSPGFITMENSSQGTST